MKRASSLIRMLLIALLFGACSVPGIQVNEDLREVNAYEVQGRNGWWINQHLSFGEYQTGKVTRGWTKGYDYPFIVRFTGAKEKLSFSIRDAKGNSAEVFCLARLEEQDLLLFHRYFDISLKVEDALSGTVTLEERPYDFYISNLNQNPRNRQIGGLIKVPGEIITIRPVENLANGRRSPDISVPGLEFVWQGRVIAAVESMNDGRVWMRSDLSEQYKLILAAISSAVLLRNDLAGHNDEI